MKVRIRFAKYGALKFIGHLDVMRYFQKAIRRADLPIAYSEGFSPHQIMSFAAPLSVGHTSEGEYLDIEVTSQITAFSGDKEILKEKLQAVMVEGISILDVQFLPPGKKNAMASVAAAAYLVSFRQGVSLPHGWQKALAAFYERDEIPVTKKTKKGEKQINLKESIYRMEVEENAFGTSFKDSVFADREDVLEDGVSMVLNAGSGENIKPAFVLDCFFHTLGYELPAFALKVHRLETYKRIGDEGELVPLIWEK